MTLVPHAHRKKLQYGVAAFCLAPLFRLIYLDIEDVQLVVFGFGIPREKIFLPVLAAGVFLGLIVFFTVKYGRFFCAHLCPVHLYLEKFPRPSRTRWWTFSLSLIPALAAESALSFVFSYRQQWEMYASQSFPQPILAAHALVLAVMAGVFLIYRERFCHSACPYAVFQNLCRGEGTVVTVFDAQAGRCIDCGACDRVCPMRLDVRKQSSESFCTNCALCIETCTTILGESGGVMTQVREHELPSAAQGLRNSPK